ncbi:pentapeptide repeat-containing protein, partial [Clostridium sp.]|uniref:pentapeptide repeat-containing protein n=1 Tax=Clostridium sp. TaxID=1506 RepID=UPI002FC62AC0
MAYVNFKEEVYKSLQQLTKRKENNKKQLDLIKSNKSLLKGYIVDSEKSFKKIENHDFGISGALSESDFKLIQDITIVGTVFIGCIFNNIKFKRCNFIGCVFNECKFKGGGVVFEECSFTIEDALKPPNLNNKINFSSSFIGGNIYPKFKNSNISYLIIENSYLINSSFENCDVTGMIVYKSQLKKISIKDCNLSGAKFIENTIEDLDFMDKNKTKLDEKTFFDKLKNNKKTKAAYEGEYMIYETIANKFKENNLNNNFGEYYYLCKNVQRKSLSPLKKVASFINLITCGYGERPSFAVYSSFVIILIYSILYLFTGIDIDGEIVRYFTGEWSSSIREGLTHYNESLTLSISMFGSVGFVNAQPAPESYMLCCSEVILGITMVGIGIGTL